MKLIRGEGLVTGKTPERSENAAALTRCMALSCEIADSALKLYNTEHVTVGMRLMETADKLAEEVGLLTDLTGYTIDEVVAPLWRDNTVANTPQTA